MIVARASAQISSPTSSTIPGTCWCSSQDEGALTRILLTVQWPSCWPPRLPRYLWKSPWWCTPRSTSEQKTPLIDFWSEQSVVSGLVSSLHSPTASSTSLTNWIHVSFHRLLWSRSVRDVSRPRLTCFRTSSIVVLIILSNVCASNCGFWNPHTIPYCIKFWRHLVEYPGYWSGLLPYVEQVPPCPALQDRHPPGVLGDPPI